MSEIKFLKKGSTPLEGYLDDNDDNKQAEILFILREPDSKGKRLDRFWFRNGVTHEGNGAKRYFNVLGRIAKKLLNEDNMQVALKKCAYINIFPFFGHGRVGENYRAVMDKLVIADGNEYCGLDDYIEYDEDSFGRLEDKDKIFSQIAQNRMYIIRNLNCKYIVTTKDIAAVLSDKSDETGFTYNGKYYFPKGKLRGGRTEVYSFYHPSYPRIAYKKLDNMGLNI